MALIGGVLAGVLAATGAAPHAPDVPTPTPTLDLGEQSGPWDLVLTDVRVGHHSGFDRVVLDLEGEGTPGWSVEYVDRARLEGSGERVRVAGESVLQVVASGTTWPGEGYYDGPRRTAGAGAVSEVVVGGTFEGYTQVFVGLSGDPARFEVTALDDPTRLVVDVKDAPPAS